MKSALLCLSAFCCVSFAADEDPFQPGTIISEFGKVAAVDSDVLIPPETKFMVRFDVGRGANKGINSSFDSEARFINLQAAAGVPTKDMQLAVVVHGSAAMDVTRDLFYKSQKKGRANGSATAVEVLQKHNVDFYICGQSAAHADIKKDQLLPGVKMAPSAMTIHALLDQQGFSLNPF